MNPVKFPTSTFQLQCHPRAAYFEPTFLTQFLLVHCKGLPLRESPKIGTWRPGFHKSLTLNIMVSFILKGIRHNYADSDIVSE